MIWVTDVRSREIINMFLVGQVSGLVENWIFSVAINQKCDKCQILHDDVMH